MAGATGELKTFRCRFRARGDTVTVECLAPSAEDAAHAVAAEVLKASPETPWVQVVVSLWIPALAQFVDPVNAIMVTRGDKPAPGLRRVVIHPGFAAPSP